MRGFNCGHHVGECPTATTSEGTFCMLYGVQVAGPALECSDFRQCCNAVRAHKPAATAAARVKQSLERCTRLALAQHKWQSAMALLYPGIDEATRNAYADAFRDWSVQLGTTPATHPGLRQWAALFSATVGDKLATTPRGKGLLCSQTDTFARNAVDPKVYHSTFGFSCKKINSTWRKIRAAAIDPVTGEIRVPFRHPAVGV